MHDDELKKMWQSAPQQEFVQFINSKENLKDMNAKIQKLDRAIEWRNLREITVAVLLIAVFLRTFFVAESGLLKLGSGMVVLGILFIIYKLVAARLSRKLPDVSVSIREQLEHSRTYLSTERKLLDNILYWYILPITIPCIIMVISYEWQIWAKVGYILIVGCIMFFAYRLNKKGTKQFDEPIRELNEAIKQLEE